MWRATATIRTLDNATSQVQRLQTKVFEATLGSAALDVAERWLEHEMSQAFQTVAIGVQVINDRCPILAAAG